MESVVVEKPLEESQPEEKRPVAKPFVMRCPWCSAALPELQTKEIGNIRTDQIGRDYMYKGKCEKCGNNIGAVLKVAVYRIVKLPPPPL